MLKILINPSRKTGNYSNIISWLTLRVMLETHKNNTQRQRSQSACRCRTFRSYWCPTFCGSWCHGGRHTASLPSHLCTRSSSETETGENRLGHMLEPKLIHTEPAQSGSVLSWFYEPKDRAQHAENIIMEHLCYRGTLKYS